MWSDPSVIDQSIESRSVSFENPTGGRGAGGTAHGGRKGAPSRRLAPGERVVLADLDGPGTIRHVWMTISPGPPTDMRAVWMEVFYDDLESPSVSVPCLDFFGLAHGRPVAYASALTTAQEGRGFNAYFPMPFRDHVRIELTNGSSRAVDLYFQIDLTLERVPRDDAGLLHASFRRENPTELRRDFVITDGIRGPGRFLGCVVGVRPLPTSALTRRFWYGEGEVKAYIDGDGDLPTICGTGLEDYVGSAWGMGAHDAPFAGAPLVVGDEGGEMPDFVGFYRWHVPDPIVFRHDLRVTIQQIGFALFDVGREDDFAAIETLTAGAGWYRDVAPGVIHALGLYERSDDYCATAFVYALQAQPVPRLDLPAALADIGRRDYEAPSSLEQLSAAFLAVDF